MPKKVLVALPAGMLEQIDFIAKEEFRSRSDLIREALRDRIDLFNRKKKDFNGKTLVGSTARGQILEASSED